MSSYKSTGPCKSACKCHAGYDASNEAIGAELIQIQEGQEKVIAYGIYALTKEQKNYCTSQKELLVIVRFCRQYRYYLLGKPFAIRTDHSSLRWLL